MNMTTLQARVSVPGKVLFRDLGGEAVLLEMDRGMYYGLNEVGTRMWHLLTGYGQAEPAFRALAEEYDVPSERLRLDLLTFLQALASRGLLHLDET